MSQISADTIKGVTAANNLTLGNTPIVSASANSLTIRGEGSNSTNVQQGLIKSWIRFNGTSTISTNDSFNNSSITDNATGVYTMNMGTAMANTNYAQTCGAGDVDHGAKINIDFADGVSNTTTAMKIRLAAAVSGNGDSNVVTNHVAGDLA
tara:strand:+ start:1754 stop:2206 length:453 start_codon:yes stop_codon:yes gene_type:complete